MTRPITIGARVAANYEVVRELSSGGYGTLFLAENRLLAGQRAVVKVLKGGKQGASAEEAKVLATVEHPNVVHVYAHDVEYDCIVMQYLSGVTLHTLVGRLNPVTAVRVAQSVALALDAVHQKQLVHRDVKPENVLVEGKGGELGWVKLIDFGLALKIGKPNELCGTPDYCPAEQFMASSSAHPASDVYALGSMLFELCASRLPFVASTSEELGHMHLNAPVPDLLTTRREVMNPKSVGGAVEVRSEVLEPRVELLLDRVNDLVHEMMAKEPELRPDAKAVARRLDEIERDFSSEATQVGFRLPTEPIQLTDRAKTSTAVLPRLEKTGSLPERLSSATLAAAAAARARRTKLGVAAALGLVAVLFLLWLGWPRPGAQVAPASAQTQAQAQAQVQVQRAPPTVVEAAAAEPLAAAALDAGELLIAPAQTAQAAQTAEVSDAPKKTTKSTANTATSRSFVVVEDSSCIPDADWKRDALADLRELTDRSAKRNDTGLMLWASTQNDEISRAINSASSRGECGAVSQRMEEFKQRVKGKGAEP